MPKEVIDQVQDDDLDGIVDTMDIDDFTDQYGDNPEGSESSEADKEPPKSPPKAQPDKQDKAQDDPKKSAQKEQPKQDEGSQDQEEGSEEEDVPKYEIDGQEFTPDQIKAFKQEFDNKANWEKKLRQISQIAANLQEDQIQTLLPYANKEKEIPDPAKKLADDIVAEMFKDEKLNLSGYSEEYEDNLDVSVESKAIADKVREGISQAMSKIMPIIDEQAQQIQQVNQDLAIQATQRFMDNRPDFRFNVPEDMSLGEYVKTVRSTGKDHPDYPMVMRYKALVDTMKENGFTSLDQAYEFLYGDKDKALNSTQKEASDLKKVQDQITNKQRKVRPEKPGQTINKTEDEIFLEDLDDPAEQSLQSILGG